MEYTLTSALTTRAKRLHSVGVVVLGKVFARQKHKEGNGGGEPETEVLTCLVHDSKTVEAVWILWIRSDCKVNAFRTNTQTHEQTAAVTTNQCRERNPAPKKEPGTSVRRAIQGGQWRRN